MVIKYLAEHNTVESVMESKTQQNGNSNGNPKVKIMEHKS